MTALDEIERTVRSLARSARGKAVNVPGELLEPHDGQPALRPHSIRGWYQVWSGGICIALLRPEDIKAAGLRPTEAENKK